VSTTSSLGTGSAVDVGAAPLLEAGIVVGGLTPLSTVDWPGELAAVVFCQGCAWNCPYCHNASLRPFGPAKGAPQGVSEPDAPAGQNVPGAPPWAEILEWLKTRQGLLDAVVFSGGEPLLQPGLARAMRDVRGLGFKIGLHTSGMDPAALARVLPLADWIGLDVKAPRAAYDRVTGRTAGRATGRGAGHAGTDQAGTSPVGNGPVGNGQASTYQANIGPVGEGHVSGQLADSPCGADATSPAHNPSHIGRDGPCGADAAWASLDLVRKSGVAFELRTTWHPDLLSEAELLALAGELSGLGDVTWALQAFQPEGCADTALAAAGRTSVPGALVQALRTALGTRVRLEVRK